MRADQAANDLVASIAPGDPALPSKQVLDERGTRIRALERMQTKLIGEDLHRMDAAHTVSFGIETRRKCADPDLPIDDTDQPAADTTLCRDADVMRPFS
jgi:hypothetical protein